MLRLLAMLLAVAIVTSSSSADARRSTSEIVWAIAKTGGPANAIGLANTIKAEAKRINADPFTFVAFFWHESSWRSGAIGDNGKAVGLGASWSWLYSAACKADGRAKALSDPSPACAAKRNALLNPTTAVRITASSIDTARKKCRTKTHRPALFHRWLSLLGGRNHPRKAFRGVWCAQHQVRKGSRLVWRDLPWRKDHRFKGIREIIDCRRSLLKRRPCRREKKKTKARRRSRRRS